MTTVALLFASNVFMTLAWYGHLRYREVAVWKVILISWGIAFFEYCLQVPANGFGYGQFTAAQLKIIQEVITVVVFIGFAWLYLGERLRWRRPSGSSSPPWWWPIFRADRRALALALVVVLAGCAGPALVFERRGVTPARQNHDLAECKKEAFDPHGFAWRQADRYDRDILNRCMTRKGYALRDGGR